ncbi:VOC family protein [candidate division WOR-3 bacterium]|nr:VOC family protein [candidate division WOR-3 bacterium]
MSKIVHIEIPAPDLAKAAEFYSKVFGWKIEHIPGMEYAMWSEDDAAVAGGFNKDLKSNPDGVLMYIGVDDIPAKLTEIEAAGGKRVQEKTKISDEFGYFALFTDMSGNRMGLWSKE